MSWKTDVQIEGEGEEHKEDDDDNTLSREFNY
jgi:hypothetical protein